MPKLYLVGITPDHTGLVLSEHARSKRGDLVLEVDERVVDAVEKARRLRAREESRGLESAALPTRRDMMTGDGTAGTRLSPREIQQRLRMGETVAGLARTSGVDEAWIERFSAPVLAEKARLIERARGLTFHKPKDGPSGVTLGPAVAANVIDKGVALTLPDLEDGWGAFQRPGGEWCVSFSFSYRGRRQVAEWDLDTKKGELVARNKLATDLGYREPGKRLPQPAPAPVAAVVAGTRAPTRPPATVIAPDIPVVEAEEEPPPGEEEAGEGPKASESAAAAPSAQADPAAPATPATKGDSTEITIPRGLIMTVRQQPVSTPQTLPGTEVGAEPGARPNGLPAGAAGAVTMAQRPAPAPVTAAAKARAAKTKPAPASTGTKPAPAPAKAAAAPPAARTAPAPPPGKTVPALPSAKAAAAPAEKAPAPPKAAAPAPPAKTTPPKAAPAPARKAPARAAPKPPPAKAAPAKPATSRRASGRRAKKVAAAPSEPLRSDAPVTPVPPPPPPVPAPKTPEPEAPAESDNPTGPVSLSSRPAPSPVKGRSSRSSSPES